MITELHANSRQKHRTVLSLKKECLKEAGARNC